LDVHQPTRKTSPGSNRFRRNGREIDGGKARASQPELIEPQPEALPEQATSVVVSDSTEKVISLETDLVDAKISTRNGGRITRWQLKKYENYYGGNVDLVSGNDRFNVPENILDIELMNRDGKTIQISNYNLKVNVANDTSIVLDENNPTAEFEFYLPIENGRLIKKYIFHHNKYSADVIIGFENLQGYLGPQRWYSVRWENGLPATEENVREDYDYARAHAYQNGELTEYDASEDEEKPKYPSGPSTEWVAIRTKYFLTSIIPGNPDGLNVELAGYGFERNDNLIKVFSTALGVSLPSPMAASHADSFKVYLGPVDYSVLKDYDVDLQTLVMSKGYEEYLRPISIPILQAFKLLHSFIPNYGFVIILFSILIKLILHPLTKKSYQSMSEMQYVQPEMAQLREKYKNDPQRLNKEMMKLYKEHGINPLGGCLPTLLQMPLLFALFIVFRSTIQLRGEPFILWITDLSLPDTLLMLNFSIPFLGNSLHVLPFLMGATMIWQSKMTMTDPKQKAMIYLMPVFMIFIFYSLPSGLNLYYAVFNVLSMFQTRMIKKKMHPDNGAAKDVKSVKDTPKAPSQKPKAQRSRKRKK
jgi:YidC/Oxa1 family membrane protein insertase